MASFVSRRLLLAAAWVLALPGAALAQAYPAKPITVLVPLQAGSAGDVVMRAVAQKMGESMRQSLVVENQAGVAGLLGAEKVSNAAPDGYLIGGISDSVLNYAAQFNDKTKVDALNGFEPVGMVANVSWVLVVHPSLGVRNLKDFLALARQRPGRIDYASAGNGSPHHISMELLKATSHISLTHIPYRGATQSIVDLAGGQVGAAMSAVSVVLPFIKDGRLVALAVPQAQRSALLPEVPTFTEAGLPGFQFSTWVGMYAPKGTPRPIVNQLNTELRKALGDPALRERLLPLGLEPAPSSPDQLREMTRSGHARVGKLIKDIGIKPE
jgi:tripartite-type tricarboxylate transporter receptor subunit TctC